MHLYCGRCLKNALKDTNSDTKPKCHYTGCDQELDDDAKRYRLEAVQAQKDLYKEQIDREIAETTRGTEEDVFGKSKGDDEQEVEVEETDEERSKNDESDHDERDIPYSCRVNDSTKPSKG